MSTCGRVALALAAGTVLAVMALGAGVIAPRAQEADREACETIEFVQAHNPAFTYVSVKDPDLARLVANYNAVEPVSDYKPDAVWVAFIKGQKTVHVMLVKNGCLITNDEILVEEFFRLMTAEPVLPGKGV